MGALRQYFLKMENIYHCQDFSNHIFLVCFLVVGYLWSCSKWHLQGVIFVNPAKSSLQGYQWRFCTCWCFDLGLLVQLLGLKIGSFLGTWVFVGRGYRGAKRHWWRRCEYGECRNGTVAGSCSSEAEWPMPQVMHVASWVPKKKLFCQGEQAPNTYPYQLFCRVHGLSWCVPSVLIC